MPDVALFTYKDAVDHGVEYLGGAAQGRDAQACRRAAHDALRDLANQRDWSVYRVHGRLNTVAPYSTGTITYDHTGGTYERQVTLASGTWPEWAAYGVLRVSGVRYSVASRESDTVLTLAADSNPGDDVAAGTEYLIYRDQYPVPVNFGKIISTLYDAESHRELEHRHPRETLRTTRLYGTTAEPVGFTLIGSSDYQASAAFEISPAPNQARTYDYLYYRRPRPLRIENEHTGTVSVTSGTLTVTGSSTAFTEAMIGSVIRLSSSTTDPTNLYGSNPYDQERIVTDVASTTSLTVDAAWETTRSAVKYVISDPVDIDPLMLNAYTAGVAAKVAHLRSKEDRALAEAAYLEELRRAACADNLNAAPRGSETGVVLSYAEARMKYGTVT